MVEQALPLGFLLLLVGLKSIASAVSIGSGFRGGLFFASLFMGAMLGIVTAVAMIAHEIPQEVGDFLILLHSGFSRRKALAYNLLSSFATLVGGLLAYYALAEVQGVVPVMLSLAAASMIYVAVADLIPGLHKRAELKATVQQVVLIGLGILSIAVTHRLVEGVARLFRPFI